MGLFDSFKANEKQLAEFAQLLGKFDAPSFIGLAKVLCVHVFDNEHLDENGKPTPRKAEDIIEDCIIAFDQSNHKRRREIIKIMRRVVKNK